MFASVTDDPAYDYDPFGAPLQLNSPMTDFGFAGMINSPESGLGLTWYREYDPVVGRWQSRDLLTQLTPGNSANADITQPPALTSPYSNVYAYVENNLISKIDPTGGSRRC